MCFESDTSQLCILNNNKNKYQYNSYEHFQKAAAEIEKQHCVNGEQAFLWETAKFTELKKN